MDVDLGDADALLLCADSERNQDLYYATHFRAPDPFVFLWTRSGKILLVKDLELDRARRQARVDQVTLFHSFRFAVLAGSTWFG